MRAVYLQTRGATGCRAELESQFLHLRIGAWKFGVSAGHEAGLCAKWHLVLPRCITCRSFLLLAKKQPPVAENFAAKRALGVLCRRHSPHLHLAVLSLLPFHRNILRVQSRVKEAMIHKFYQKPRIPLLLDHSTTCLPNSKPATPQKRLEFHVWGWPCF